MKGASHTIQVHRAPVLALWATVVAERLGYNRDTALTLGYALILRNDVPPLDGWNGVPEIELLGRQIPVVETPVGIRSLLHKTPCSPEVAERYLKSMFGDALEDVRAGMERLAHACGPRELMENGFELYEAFRPEAPSRRRGAGREEVLRLGRLLALVRVTERQIV